ncbi:hypothetical protein GN244_ATG19157 [Phytophthora infestans]|uniref:Uncharacterized protein n=1 Tax=Phytophthora infestans TaxID=4787 RepID=A0A833S7K0_PHYIN|nr:hypothetical protein GN244_ATG19157 [Phytophthora infestans]
MDIADVSKPRPKAKTQWEAPESINIELSRPEIQTVCRNGFEADTLRGVTDISVVERSAISTIVVSVWTVGDCELMLRSVDTPLTSADLARFPDIHRPV